MSADGVEVIMKQSPVKGERERRELRKGEGEWKFEISVIRNDKMIHLPEESYSGEF